MNSWCTLDVPLLPLASQLPFHIPPNPPHPRLMQRMQQEVEQARLQEFVQNVTEKCHKKCAGTSGSQLDKREQGCYSMCMDRYADTVKVVTQALQARNDR